LIKLLCTVIFTSSSVESYEGLVGISKEQFVVVRQFSVGSP